MATNNGFDNGFENNHEHGFENGLENGSEDGNVSNLKNDFETAFRASLGGMLSEGRVSAMRAFPQHGSVSTYDHVLSVARTALRLSRALRMPVSERELVRGAVLHDYYLYDWHDPSSAGHATQHPLRALEQAKRDFDLTDKERNIIASHMWPLPPTRVPKSPEAWLVCAADKWCSLVETLTKR